MAHIMASRLLWKRQSDGAFGDEDYDDYDGYDSWWWSPVSAHPTSERRLLPTY